MKYLKKLLVMMVALTVAVTGFPTGYIQAEALNNSDYDYTITDNEVTITKYHGKKTEVEIPSSIDGYPVTKIEGFEDWWPGFRSTKVVIPEGVKEIGAKAFSFSTTLKEITIPESVEKIADNAFASCLNLETVYYNVSSSEMECVYMFNSCKNIKKVQFGNKVKKICKNMFDSNQLKEITIPEGVEEIGLQAFILCSNLETLYFNATHLKDTTYIDKYSQETMFRGAFENCYDIKTIVLGNKVEVLSKQIFASTLVENVILPDSLKEIREEAFSYSRLKEIIIPENVKEIKKDAFVGTPLYVIEIHNPTCVIDDSSKTIGANAVIVGYENSSAHDYAIANHRVFISFESQNYVKKNVSLQVGEEISGKDIAVSERDTFQALSNYRSDKEEIATVDEEGTIRGIAPGKTMVIMKDANRDIFAILEVEVTEKQSEDESTTSETTTSETTTESEKSTAKEETTEEDATVVEGTTKEVSTKKDTVWKKSKILKIKSKKKSLKVRWKKVFGISGYQLQYSKYKNFKKKKTITIRKAKKTSKIIKNLKGKKTYFVRIRTYQNVGKNVVKSDWSKPKRKKTK
ncbi:MAG: leucine-rich repeat domain-containing protein [Eubacterium sp.]|nr:leucine-rich repeat domain-containing protein [Eubacterium sp.]